MDHHFGVSQSKAFARRTSCQQNGTATGGQADAVGRNRTTNHLHRIVYRHRGSHAASRRIDIEVNVLASVLTLQVEQLHHQFVGIAIPDFTLEKHDAILQQ